MSYVSLRAQQLAVSETLKITALAKELQRQGKSVISLSAGEPDFRTPDYICEAAHKAIRDGHHGYTVNAGTVELRELIAQKLQRDNSLTYKANDIICCNGAKPAIAFAIMAVVNPGEEVIIPAPYWVSYPEMVKLAQGVSVPVSTTVESDYKMTPAQLEAAITPKTKALILCSPSNPTGSCYSADELKALAEVLRKHPQVLIISDEIYEYITFGTPHVSIGTVAPDLFNRLLVVNGFSKGFAMTGWRLGYLAGPSDIVAAIGKIQSQLTSAPSTITQKAGEAALSHPLDQVFAMRDEFEKRRNYVVQALRQIPGLKCINPGGAFYAFPDISAYLGKTAPNGTKMVTSTDIVMYLLEAVGVAAVPGDAFGDPNGLRISYATSMQNLEEALRRLKQGFESFV
jgi:aspartate aminotransferase